MTAALLALVLGATAVHVEPAVLTLGTGSTAQIEVLALGPADAPLPDAKVSIEASLGQVSKVEALGGGRFRATFTPPPEHHPLVALFEVRIEARGKVTRAWASLPIRASAVLKIETKRHARVNVDVGPLKYGPVRANGRGKVRLHALVPPGVATATVHSVDEAGNSSDKQIPLYPKPYPRVRAALSRSVASWIDPQPVEIEVFAVSPDGQPIADPAKVRCTAKLGQVGAPVKRGVAFVFPYRAPGVISAEQDELQVGPVDGEPAVLHVELRPGPPVKIAVALEPSTYLAGSGTPVRVVTTVTDAKGNRLAGAHPALSADFGQLVESASGAVLKLPDAFAGRTQVAVRAVAGDRKGEAVLGLKAALAAKAMLELPERKVHAGRVLGASLALRDRFGNPTDAEKVVVAALGRKASLVPAGAGAETRAGTETGAGAGAGDGAGAYQVQLASEKLDAPGPTRLEIRGPEEMLGGQDFTVLEYQRPWGFSLGIAAVGQSNFQHATAAVPRVELGFRLGRTEAQLIAQVEDRFYATFHEPLNGALVTGKVSGFAYALGVRYAVPLTAWLNWQSSIVAGGFRTRSELSATDFPGVKQTEIRPTGLVRAASGISYRAGPGRIVTELQYELSPAKGQLKGNLGGLGFAGGYLIGF